MSTTNKPTLDKKLTCEDCGKQDVTVSVRACGYYADVHNDPSHMETVCNDCEYQHIMDI